jgi:hypothetical protein
MILLRALNILSLTGAYLIVSGIDTTPTTTSSATTNTNTTTSSFTSTTTIDTSVFTYTPPPQLGYQVSPFTLGRVVKGEATKLLLAEKSAFQKEEMEKLAKQDTGGHMLHKSAVEPNNM